MRSSTTTFSVLAVAATLVVPPLTASAQNQSPSSSPPSTTSPSQSTPSADISEQKLDAAAAAVKGVATVKQDYEQKLAQAPRPEQDRLVDEAQTAMAKAVTDQGLTVEEYTKILQVAQNDPTVHEKIIQRLKLNR